MLEALRETDFVLTGASALVEHGIIHRETSDVDLFTVGDEGQRIPDAIPLLREALAERGAVLTVGREFPGFVDGRIAWGDYEIGFDLGADWRAYPAVTMDIGPVLDIRDSVASKTAALYSRHEIRDYIDVAAIVLDGRWTPEQIMGMGANNDPGLDRTELARFIDPDYPDFPRSGDFRDMGFDQATENRMRDALTVLRAAALGQDMDFEAAEALRVASPGRTHPLPDQLRHAASEQPSTTGGRAADRSRSTETDRER